MKTTIYTAALLLFAFGVQAQNKNVTNVTKTTVTTVKDSDGEKQIVKQQDVKEVQNIELKDPDSKTLNKEMKVTPVEVVSTTKITNPDGSTRTVDVDRSSVYTASDGKSYKVALDPYGYTMYSEGMKKPALLRKTSTNSYLYRGRDKTALGYFDTDGNLVIETYDDKSDKVSIEKYTVVKQ
ncbi:hypothetical protein [Flavobacterium sp. 3HN19-14]|uniref:hypothetical protein n=1 Tax=Flavobacterium sp. 3HN19-14 TaxID=3448133 RepID=UPI003EDF3E52